MSEAKIPSKKLLATSDLKLSIAILREKFIPAALTEAFPADYSKDVFQIDKIYHDAEKATGILKPDGVKITLRRTGEVNDFKRENVETKYTQTQIERVFREILPDFFPAIKFGGCKPKELTFNWQDINAKFEINGDSDQNEKQGVVITFPIYTFETPKTDPIPENLDKQSENGHANPELAKELALAN